MCTGAYSQLKRYLACFLFNEKVSIRTQVVTSFLTLVVVGCGLTLAICYGLLYGTGSTSYDTAQSTIISDTKQNLFTEALEIAAALEQQLTIVGDSVCKYGSFYSSSLMKSSFETNIARLKKMDSFADYNFENGCSYPDCPSDFGAFNGKTRLPPLEGFAEGSVSQTSVYLYSKMHGQSATNQSMWRQFATQDVNQTIDALAYQDLDLAVQYFRGPNTTVFFYVSAQVDSSSPTNYFAVHRTFPGISKRNDPSYDPPQRGWFRRAPEEGIYLYGPYQETFTKLQVINLSSRRTIRGDVFRSDSRKEATVVVAAVMLLSDLQQRVHSISYSNGGFAAVLRRDTREVLVWKEGVPVFVNSSFVTIGDLEPSLASVDLGTSRTFRYRDSSGASWYVSVVPFFDSTNYETGRTSAALSMLVFAKQSEAESSLIYLQESIDSTTSTVTMKTIIIICGVTGGVLLLIVLLVCYIVWPLNKMRQISEEIVRIATEDEDKKDYSRAVTDSFFNQQRRDEIGALTSTYFQVVAMLHNKSVEKRRRAKYPANPFYLPYLWDEVAQTRVEPAKYNWEYFRNSLEEYHKGIGTPLSTATTAEALEVTRTPAPIANDDLDVLGSLTAAAKRRQQMCPCPADGCTDGVISQDSTTMRLEQGHRPANTPYAQLPSKSEEPSEQVIEVDVHARAFGEVNVLTSIRTKFYLVSALLLAGLIAVMIVTVVALRDEGSDWMSISRVLIESKQLETISAITESKAYYVKAFFKQMTVDMLVSGNYVSLLMNGNLTEDVPVNQSRPASFSLDPTVPFPYRAPTNFSLDFSGYFYPDESNCASSSCYEFYNQLNTTKLTSLVDTQFKSYFFNGSIVSFVQIGLESRGFMRQVPYQPSSGLSHPSSCLVSKTQHPVCAAHYDSSGCSNPYSSFYYPYDPRCRNWYQFALSGGDPDTVYFQYPRKSRSGLFVITSVIPVRIGGKSTGSVIGVINMNILAQEFSNNINNLRILRSGYTYLIDKKNFTQLVMHPRASSSCIDVLCAEGFSSSEYAAFVSDVLVPIENGGTTASFYQKKGKRWTLKHASVSFGGIDYVLIATVPIGEVQAASDKVQGQIDSAVISMIVAFAFVMAVFCAIMATLTYCIVEFIVEPITALHAVLRRVANDDLTSSVSVGSTASSLDIKILLEAFASLIVALRFGSESYARGNDRLALDAFIDALELYTVAGNRRGIGAAHNNLGAVFLNLKDYTKAIEHFEEAIKIGGGFVSELQSSGASSEEIIRARRTLSDRKGNLAVAYLQSGKGPQAFSLLENLLQEDKTSGYLLGCVIKQGLLGNYYQQQGEFKSAERVFKSVLEFIQVQDGSMFGDSWDAKELGAAEEIALYNIGSLYEAQHLWAPAEAVYVEALSKSPTMHTQTTRKILLSLRGIFTENANTIACDNLTALAETHEFQLVGAAARSNTPKRVAFCVDYSGSMSGSKIRTAVENMEMVVRDHLGDSDSVMLLQFNSSVIVAKPLTVKRGNEEEIIAAIRKLTEPNGATALYQAIMEAKNTLRNRPSEIQPPNDWIVALTDGQDNSSRTTHHSQLLQALRSSDVNVIVIGIGSDVEEHLLQAISGATPKGVYIFASGDKSSMDKAFGEVVKVIGGQIVLED